MPEETETHWRGGVPKAQKVPEAYAAWLYRRWSDRELAVVLLDYVEEMDEQPDMDGEGHDETIRITVLRMALRELMRRTRDERNG